MNNPERCFSAQIGRHCVVESVYMCEGEGEMGHGGVGIHPSPQYYAVVKNICNARRYFEKYLKKKKIQYRADLLLGVCKEIHSASNLEQS